MRSIYKIQKIPVSSILKILSAVILISLSAQFSFEFTVGHTVVPITLQSLSVLVLASFLRPVESLLAVVLYISLGGIGIPIFADGTAGFSRLIGPTGGYFLGFLLAAVVISYVTFSKSPSFIELMDIMLLGTVIILVPGFLYLSYLKGTEIAWQYGFINLYKGALVKVVMGAIITWAVKRYLAIHSKTS